jgi:hypothetical protein
MKRILLAVIVLAMAGCGSDDGGSTGGVEEIDIDTSEIIEKIMPDMDIEKIDIEQIEKILEGE